MLHIFRDGHANAFVASGWFAVIEHHEGIAERLVFVVDDIAFVLRQCFEVSGIRLIPRQNRLIQPGPFDRPGWIVRPGNTDRERIGFVSLESPAYVGQPVLAIVFLQLVGAAPCVILKGDIARGLHCVPSAWRKAHNFTKPLPVEQVAALGKERFIAGAIEDDVCHVPLIPMTKNAGAVELFAAFSFEYDAVFERSSHLLVDAAHGFRIDVFLLRFGGYDLPVRVIGGTAECRESGNKRYDECCTKLIHLANTPMCS